MLEIGVLSGSSLRMWQTFFPNAEVVGIDVESSCLQHASGNAIVEICDQSDVDQLTLLASRHGPFDLVVDDGSHVWSHQILTFETLFPHVNKGGSYIIEDIDTSFGHYTSVYGKDSTVSAAQYVTKLVNYVMGSTAAPLSEERDLRLRSFVKSVDSITIVRRAALIRRK